LSRSRRLLLVSVVGLVVMAGAVSGYVRDGIGGEGIVFALGAISMLSTGAILVLKVPENKLSWLLLVVAFGLGTMSLFETSAGKGTGGLIGGLALFLIVLPGLGVFLPLWFPTGRPPSNRWRWVGAMTIVGIGLIPVSWLLVEFVENGDSYNIESCNSLGTCSSIIGLILLLAGVVSAVTSLIFRWFKSRGVERVQMKWLVLAFVVFLIGVLAEFGGFQYSIVAEIFLPAGLFLIPITIVIAVTRYRLYEIDRILSRTVAYVIVIALLGAAYFVGLTAMTNWLPSDSPLAVATSTLAVAALFNPVRKRVQAWVDRRFNRSRYNAQLVVDQFAGSLRDRVDSGEVVDGWVGVVADTMQPVSAGVWVRESR
jgi:hypothetical protein